MLLLINGNSKKAFEKHFWSDKGKLEGPGKEIQEEDEEDMLKKKKPKSKVINGNDIESLKAFFVYSMEQMTEKLHKDISTLIDVSKMMSSRMEKIEEGIKEIHEVNKITESKMEKVKVVVKGLQKTGLVHEEFVEENDFRNDTCYNKPSEKKTKPLSNYELKDMPVEELTTKKGSKKGKMNDGGSKEQEESCVKTLSETSSIRDRNMRRQLEKISSSIKALIKEE